MGIYWFEDGKASTVTVTQEKYCTIICMVYEFVSRRQGIVIIRQWFMQDGASLHAGNTTLESLEQKFGDRVISPRTGNQWAAHFPDLNFFPLGYIKNIIYHNNPTTLQDLKKAITRFIRALSPDMCKRVIGNFAVRLNECVNRRGAHIN